MSTTGGKHASYDPHGFIFVEDGEIYRGIYSHATPRMKRVIDSGLITTLVREGMFPQTEITDKYIEGCGMVLKHHRISVISLPYEWSFEMLKDAARLILRVNQIAREYNYQTIDAHGFNVAFDKGKPVFLDIGSFVELKRDFKSGTPGWRPLGEFYRSFIGPLMLWARGDTEVARGSLHGAQVPMTTFWKLGGALWAKVIPREVLKRLEFAYFKWKALNTTPRDRFEMLMSVSVRREHLAKVISKLDAFRLLPFLSVSLVALERRVTRISRKRFHSAWGNYHSGMPVSARHHRILSIIEKYGISSILDMAGNAGFVSRLICENYPQVSVICADYDENAIDTLYKSLRDNSTNITPVLMNFGTSISDDKFDCPQLRFKSQLVMALALTHHLLLRQGMTIEFILNRLRSFSREFVIVEFMPMGLFSSEYGKAPRVPSWYTVGWFREAFERYFELIAEEETDLNRIMFFGQLRPSP